MPERESPEQLADTLIILGSVQGSSEQEPALDQASRNGALAAQLLANADYFPNGIVAISENSPIMTQYLEELGTIDPNVRESNNNQVQQIIDLLKDEALGEIALLTAEGSNNDLLEQLENHGVNMELISPDEEIGKKITHSRHDLNTILRALRDFARFRGIKNIRMNRLTLNRAS